MEVFATPKRAVKWAGDPFLLAALDLFAETLGRIWKPVAVLGMH